MVFYFILLFFFNFIFPFLPEKFTYHRKWSLLESHHPIQMWTPGGTLKSPLLLWRSDICDASFWLFAAWLILNICLICKWYLPVTAGGEPQTSFLKATQPCYGSHWAADTVLLQSRALPLLTHTPLWERGNDAPPPPPQKGKLEESTTTTTPSPRREG